MNPDRRRPYKKDQRIDWVDQASPHTGQVQAMPLALSALKKFKVGAGDVGWVKVKNIDLGASEIRAWCERAFGRTRLEASVRSRRRRTQQV